MAKLARGPACLKSGPGHTHTINGFFKHVEALLQIHLCFFPHCLAALPATDVCVQQSQAEKGLLP